MVKSDLATAYAEAPLCDTYHSPSIATLYKYHPLGMGKATVVAATNRRITGALSGLFKITYARWLSKLENIDILHPRLDC